MKLLSYDSYKKLIMDTTHPRNGKKVAFMVPECHVSKLSFLRALESMKGLRLFIVYRKSQSGNAVIELDNLNEFGKAQIYAAYHSWPFIEFQDHALMINGGHADLNILVDYRPNRTKIAEFLKTMRPSADKTYSGRPLKELTA